MMQNRIRGRRVHFAGRADDGTNPRMLQSFLSLLKRLSKRILAEGGGLVVGLGDEPRHKEDPTLSLIFDWVLLEAFDEYKDSVCSNWPDTRGLPIVAVGLSTWKDKMPADRKALWDDVIQSGRVELVQVESGLSVGGVLREKQAALGDILVAAGGGPGVEHLADLYASSRKPVIPLDIQIKTKSIGSAVKLSTLATQKPERFFDYEPLERAAAAYSMLSMKDRVPPEEEFEERFFGFLCGLAKPKAFFVRLLDRKADEFKDVERFFRHVVNPVIEDEGYQRFEMMRDSTRETFMNVEIFQTLLASALVVVDLTGLRPNCFTELGYALGLKKKVIITARERTSVPFDTNAFPCYFYSPEMKPGRCREGLQEFIRIHINRKPINA